MKTPKKLQEDIGHLARLMYKAESKYRNASYLTDKENNLLKEYCDEQADQRFKFKNELSYYLKNNTGSIRISKKITVPARRFMMRLQSLLVNFDPDYLLESCMRADEKCFLEYERILSANKIPSHLSRMLKYQMEDMKDSLTWVIQLKRAL